MENVNKSQNGQKRSRNPALWKENVAKERRNKVIYSIDYFQIFIFDLKN